MGVHIYQNSSDYNFKTSTLYWMKIIPQYSLKLKKKKAQVIKSHALVVI